MRALVTGASRGIGRAIAEQLVAKGYRVVASGRDISKLDELTALYPGRVSACTADLQRVADRNRLLDEALRAFGGIDVFVSAAGIVKYVGIADLTDDEVRAQIETNLIAPLLLARDVAKHMGQGGAMVFVASTLASSAAPCTAAYAASKAGLLASMRSLALELGPRGIRANAVSPGIVETDMVKERSAAEMSALRELHPLGRFPTAADVAEAALYLIEAPWVTATDLVVDSGLTLRA